MIPVLTKVRIEACSTVLPSTVCFVKKIDRRLADSINLKLEGA